MYHLKKHLPKKGHVLDLSKNLLNIAENKFKKAKLTNKLKNIVHGSATDLSMFKDNGFDVIISMRPFYHLTEIKDINKVIREIKRVAKKNAIIEISAISYYGIMSKVLKKYQHELTDKSHMLMFSKGVHKPHKKDLASGKSTFPDAKFFRPIELKNLLEKNGFKTITMFSCEGLSTHQIEATNKLYKNKKRWKKWMKLLIDNSEKPDAIGYTEHFGWIGRK